MATCIRRITDEGVDAVINWWTPGSPGTAVLTVLEKIASIVVASLGIAGVLSGAALGGTLIGLTVYKLLVNRLEPADLPRGPKSGKRHGISYIVTMLAVATLFGVLTITNVMSTSTLGWLMLAPTLTCVGSGVYCSPCITGGVMLAKR
jgi:hypothetical protein